MKVIKSSGELERFSSKKIYYTIRNAGGSKRLAKDAIKLIKKKYNYDVSTREILLTLLNFLKKEKGVSEKYDLKRAMMSLGPSGFPFESFFARILDYYGYKTSVDNKLKGKIIYHEVDIVAIKGDKKFMIEAKYHNERGIITKLKPAMYTYARFLDLKRQKFNAPWLVTNTRCSQDAINYAKGVGLKMTAWKYPKKDNLQELIMKKNLYPITILKSLSPEGIKRLYDLKILVAKDLFNFSPEELSRKIHLDKKVILKIIEEAKEVCSYSHNSTDF